MSKEIHDYDKPGYKPPVRCHRCGITKHPEDIGVEQQFEVEGREGPNHVETVWFHNQECRDLWVEDYKDKVVKIIE